ncbi:hypothetical protein N7447_004016 [Penicillium robsamsonii]|uniref:uncharacterized protein n=1 Tax=Penicillium robsamsonii TaxID=1792511 RepID=UPI0025482B93|nr:uncharacterized protein N7447_004016 [Penicillium robsamsonii]KAJ5827253.1 hypothetical protein N7447_004016 [Penicillium robsamsonii]
MIDLDPLSYPLETATRRVIQGIEQTSVIHNITELLTVGKLHTSTPLGVGTPVEQSLVSREFTVGILGTGDGVSRAANRADPLNGRVYKIWAWRAWT